MPSYSAELDKLIVERQNELQRKLFPEETVSLCIGLVETWFETGKTDALIRYLLSEFSREGGLQEISALARLLTTTQDLNRIEVLFRSLIARRVKAYYGWWSRAKTGHIGSMRSAAHAMAEAMDIYVEYCIWLDKLGLSTQYETVRTEMLGLQARESVLRKAPKEPKPANHPDAA